MWHTIAVGTVFLTPFFLNAYLSRALTIEAVVAADHKEMMIAFDQWRLRRLDAKYPEDAFAGRAFAAAGARQTELAFSYARKAIEARDPMIVFLTVDRSFAELGEDRRLRIMLREIGLETS